jgi:uncharacterized protein
VEVTVAKVVDLGWRRAVLVAVCVGLVWSLAVRPQAAGTVSLTSLGTAYTQDFNTLASSGTSSAVPDGWWFSEVGSNANGLYAAGTGSSNAGDVYSFGAGGSSERALGQVLSGSLNPTIGAQIVNDTGRTITSLTITYAGEQWRVGQLRTGSIGDRLDFQLSTNATSLTSGLWSDYNALDFSSPVISGGTSNSGIALDGNAAGNRRTLSYTITGLEISNGAVFWIRWADFNISGSDDGLGVDDFSITADGLAEDAAPSIASVTPPNGATDVAANTNVAVTFSEAVNVSGAWFTLSCATSGVVTAVVAGGPTSFTIDPDADLPPGDTCTLTVFASQVTDQDVNDPPDTMAADYVSTFRVLVPRLSVAIHEIQGPGVESPLPNALVVTTGIVTGVKYNGFFLEAPDAEADSNPMTSEGVFVYTGSTPPVLPGDRVRVSGQVQEYFGMTEISGSPAIERLSSGNALPTPLMMSAADTTTPPVDGLDARERFEGMRVRVDSLSVTGPTDGNAAGVSNGLFYGVITGVARPFREPGLEPAAPAIEGMPPGVPRFDGNVERICVDSDALGAPTLEVTAGAIVTDLVGPLEYSYDFYTIDPDHLPTVTGNVVAIPVPDLVAGEFTVASFNMLDFTSASTNRMTKASLAIREILGTPDVIGVQEVRDLATLQALAARVNADAGTSSPGYVAYMKGSGSQRVGFLVKSTVTVASVTEVAADPTLIDRPPLVLRGTLTDPRASLAFPITVVVNHLRSMINVDAVGASGDLARTKRRAGAEFLAGLLQSYQQAGEHVISVGDYNAFQFNDGYVDVIGTVLGSPTPGTQVLLPSADLVDPNFTDLVQYVDAAQRYSYIETGNAQVLDHVVVSANMLTRSPRLVYARMDADFPVSYSTDPSRPERLADHDPAVSYFSFPSADLSLGVGAVPPTTALSGSSITYTVTVENSAADAAQQLALTDTLPSGLSLDHVTAPPGWTCNSTASSFTCTADALASKSSAIFTVVAQLDCSLANDVTLGNTFTVTAATYDPVTGNNASTVTTTISNPPPTITLASAGPATLWPVNHKMVPVAIEYSVHDNCDPAPTCTLSVASSEPTDGRGDGRTATDWKVVDPHHVLLRAERSGTGKGRTYTVGIACTDGNGYTGTQNVTVTVPKSQK